jgi:hypothetical protein
VELNSESNDPQAALIGAAGKDHALAEGAHSERSNLVSAEPPKAARRDFCQLRW